MSVDVFRHLAIRSAVGVHALVFGTDAWIDQTCEHPEFVKAFLDFAGLR